MQMNCGTALIFAITTATSGQTISPDSLHHATVEVREAAHLVFHSSRTVHFEVAGVRDIENGSPLTADTIMRIYSLTKPITSVTAMTLHDRGKFNLDDAVSQYIPAFQHTTVFVKDGESHRMVPANRQMTIRDVFRHTTGFGYDRGGNCQLQVYYLREGILYRPPHGTMPPLLNIANATEALTRIPA